MTGARARSVCPRCVAPGAGSEALTQTLRELVEALPEDRRADEAVRLARLSACRACEWLAEGTCVLCGCYVEYRAAQKHRRCPKRDPAW